MPGQPDPEVQIRRVVLGPIADGGVGAELRRHDGWAGQQLLPFSDGPVAQINLGQIAVGQLVDRVDGAANMGLDRVGRGHEQQ